MRARPPLPSPGRTVPWLFGGLCLLASACDPAPEAPRLPTVTPCTADGPTLRAAAAGTTAAWLGVWQAPDGAAWIVGGGPEGGAVAHYTRGRLSRESLPEGPALWWAWGDPASGALWAVGDGGRILRRDPVAGWQPEASGLDDKAVLWGIWGSGPDDLWAVGGSARRGGPKGLVLRRGPDGVWRRLEDPALPRERADDPLVGLNLYKVWGRGPAEVWLVGEAGESFFFDGERLTRVPGAEGELLFTVHGHGPEPAASPYAVGGLSEGRLYRLAAEGWAPAVAGPLPVLNGVFAGQDEVLATGARGSILVGQGERWCRLRPQPDYALATLHAASLGPHRWAVGGDLGRLTDGVIVTDAPIDEVDLP